MQLKRLTTDDLALIATIDRSEHVEVEYAVIDGQLTERPVTMTDISAWDPVGSGDHSVAFEIAFCAPLVAGGAAFFGAFAGEVCAGVAVLDPAFEPGLAWLAFLHVSRPHRRGGVAQSLWNAATELARREGADSVYVSATPTGSAIGFYLRQGCRLADPVHPALFAHEPDDVHLVCPLY